MLSNKEAIEKLEEANLLLDKLDIMLEQMYFYGLSLGYCLDSNLE